MNIEDVRELLKSLDPEKTTKFSLSNKNITEIPDEIGKLKNVEYLDLSFNDISVLPPALFELTKLNTLLLFRNEISVIPPEIKSLQHLSLLDISYNQISELPPELCSLINLESLDASYNSLLRIPMDLVKLYNLKKLYLEDNPLEFPPEKVVKRGLYAIMYHLTEEKRRRDAAKVILQIYNMPDEIRLPFTQYINCFNEVISSANKNEIRFDVKYIEQNFQAPIEIDQDVENYLQNFLKFIRENIGSLKATSTEAMNVNMFDLQVIELRNQIANLSTSLNEKVNDLKNVQTKLDKFVKLIDSKSK